MINNENDILFNRFKTSVGFYRSKKFKAWFHQKYPCKEQHHLFGSYGSRKTSDFCSIPVGQIDHIKAHKDIHTFAIDHLPEMISVMTEYILHLEDKK
jgi:hypothetical protein